MLTRVNDLQPGRIAHFDRGRETEWFPDIQEEDFWDLVESFWDFTALGTAALYNVYQSLRYVFHNRIEGDIVECGVFLGGSVMFAMEMCKRFDYSDERRVFALDTFSGFRRHDVVMDRDLVTGQEICHVGAPGWSFAKEAQNNLLSVGFARLLIVEGDVLETAPDLPTNMIAFLRLDTDTYDTTKFELDCLHQRVCRGGVVVVDDYGFNFGCKTAVDEFLEDRRILALRGDRYFRSWVRP